MEGAEIIVLPVARVERVAEGLSPIARALTLSDLAKIPASVVDMAAFRVRRARAMVERRSSRSLLPDLGSPGEVTR